MQYIVFGVNGWYRQARVTMWRREYAITEEWVVVVRRIGRSIRRVGESGERRRGVSIARNLGDGDGGCGSWRKA